MTELDRREFVWALGAMALAARVGRIDAQTPAATVLYDGRAVPLDRVGPDPGGSAQALWIHREDLPRINEFELKPEGACRADLCIPIPPALVRGEYFDLTGFARRAGQTVLSDPAERVWSFGEIPVVRGAFLESRQAPEFAVPDRQGRTVRPSHFRGKKLLVVTWASW